MDYRTCRTCGESKPATPEFFNRAATNTGGLNRQCRACRKAWATAYRETNREKIRVQNRAGEARALAVEGTCDVEGCDQPVYRKPHSYCGAHYTRFRRYGDPLGTFESKARDITGQRFGMLVVLRQDGNRWLVECDCGARKRVEGFNLWHGSVKSCGAHLRAVDVTYGGIHQRVKRDRGVPSEHRCIDCGKQAQDWSYDHADLDELTSEKGAPYSAHIEHYQPRCKSCHRIFDYAHARKEASGEHTHGGPDPAD